MSLVEEKLIIPEPDFISGLNSEQKAVMNIDGPLLVLSGAELENKSFDYKISKYYSCKKS